MTVLDSRSSRAQVGPRVVGDLAWYGERWQRWDGKKWKAALYSLQPDVLRAQAAPPTWPELPAHRLDRVLALAVERHVMDHGGTVIHEGPHGPVLGYPKTVNHLLYAVLTVLTFGIGAFFWLLAVLERREERIQLQVDKWGHVWGQRGASV
ncbi:hypothetical protein [Nocardioides endophyticus]|uniref:hypothetical protein n=1 Tax=Nocardioides endophyticus TaxID=1353775 RepID=UPI0031ECF15B